MKTFLVSVLVLSALTNVGLAEAPRVRFDVPQIVAVRDVTTREFAFVHPQERLIAAAVPISLLLERGPAEDVRELVHRLESTTAGAQTVDYFPKTTLATSVVGTTRVERNQAQDVRASIDANALYYGLASAQAHGEYNNRRLEESSFEELPALELLTASGTVDRGRGVYFKLKPSPRTTLEGAHQFYILLRVPQSWRSGLLYVNSEARGVERTMLPGGDASTIVGRGKFVVALYQQGDVEAQQAAQRYANAESAVRQLATTQRGALERRTYPTPFHKLGVTRDNALARDWQEAVIFRGTANSELLERLPIDLRVAVEALLKSRQELIELHQRATLAAIRG